MIIPTRLRDSAQLKGLDTDCCFYAGNLRFSLLRIAGEGK